VLQDAEFYSALLNQEMMNRNSLERFILENREQFDSVQPREGIWSAIDQALDSAAKPQTLEHFLANNRDAFDFAEPNSGLWAKIDSQFGKKEDCNTVEAFIAVKREAFNTAEPTRNVWAGIEKALNQNKQNSLKTFIQANREAFDEATPSFRVWTEIDQVLHPQQKQRTLGVLNIRRVLSIAASILLLLAVGAASGIYFMKQQVQEAAAVASLEDISPEYAEMVRYYDAQIKEKAQQVSLQTNDKTVMEDLKAVDNAMAELEAELKKAPKGAEEQLVASLIKSYQIKLSILERVLERIQSAKKDSTKQNLEDDEVSI
jgi:hypothetical protein